MAPWWWAHPPKKRRCGAWSKMAPRCLPCLREISPFPWCRLPRRRRRCTSPIITRCCSCPWKLNLPTGVRSRACRECAPRRLWPIRWSFYSRGRARGVAYRGQFCAGAVKRNYGSHRVVSIADRFSMSPCLLSAPIPRCGEISSWR